MTTVGVYPFEAKIASRGYHDYKETSWSKARDGEEVKVELETSQSSKKVGPYACVICTKEGYFRGWKIVGHIPREISIYIYYNIKTEGGFLNEAVISTKYLPSPVAAGGLEILLNSALNFRGTRRLLLRK